MNAKCPACEEPISNLNLERGPLGNSVFGPLVAGYAATCPRCRAVLGIMSDPDAIAQQVVAKLTKAR